jgi:cytochrome c-type biogenesis protein CcmH/NrfG
VAVPYVQQPAPPASTPAVVPEGEQFTQYRQKLEQNPNDHETRLKLARELEKHGSVNASLEHYETLIESSTSLEVVAADLAGVISRVPAHPKVRRLLGDTYMRQGHLQEALDTYRGALNQL